MKATQQLYRAGQSLNGPANPKGKCDDWAARPLWASQVGTGWVSVVRSGEPRTRMRE